MSFSMNIGASSMENASEAINIIGNNVANLNTSGFKRSRSVSTEAFSSYFSGAVGRSQRGNGANPIISQRIVTQGINLPTDNALDSAIEGNGWFVLRDPANNTLAYTRAGNFNLDENLFLTHLSGTRVQGYAVSGGVQDTALSDINITSLNTLGSPTTTVTVKGNLDGNAAILGTAAEFRSSLKTDDFVVVQGTNDQIVFDTAGNSVTASLVTDGGLVSGAHSTGAQIAAAVKQALETANGTADTYDVAYDKTTDKFTVTSSLSNGNTINLRHDLGTSTASGMLGFVASASGELNAGDAQESDLEVAFNVVAGANDTLNMDFDGNALNLTIDAGNYSGKELAYAIEKAVRAASPLTARATATYDRIGGADYFRLFAPRTGGDTTITQPSTGQTISITGSTVQVTGGTLTASTGWDTGTQLAGGDDFDITDPFATSSASTLVDVVDDQGNSHKVTIFFRKVGENVWDWHSALTGTDIVGTTPDTFFEELGRGTLNFSTDGLLDTETTVAGTGVFNFEAGSSGVVPTPGQVIAFDFGNSLTTDGGTGEDAMSQFGIPFVVTPEGLQSRAKETLSLSIIQSDGIPAGALDDVSINKDGYVQVNFSNGESDLIYRLAMAIFPSEEELSAAADNLYTETNESGVPVLTSPGLSGGGVIITKSLEQSNVDIAEEFGEMILQQQAFQASARVITTSDRMLEILSNLT